MVTSEAWGKNTFPSGLFLIVRCADLLLWEYLQARMRLTKSGIYIALGHTWEEETKYVTKLVAQQQGKKVVAYPILFLFL